MKGQVWVGIFLLLLAGGQGWAGEPGCCEPPQEGFWQRWHPVGGWNPYGGGLLHWWNPCCYPPSGAPDDYWRKKLPDLCPPDLLGSSPQKNGFSPPGPESPVRENR
ncbi:MAG: hypothetical protein JO112_15950 [Planctomycetes bacterium]|nr:hypothetical protein [Planctomycetota bacterium]